MLLNVSPDVQQGMCQGGKTKRIRAREETRNEKGLNICTQSSLSILVTINRLTLRMNNNISKRSRGFYSAHLILDSLSMYSFLDFTDSREFFNNMCGNWQWSDDSVAVPYWIKCNNFVNKF